MSTIFERKIVNIFSSRRLNIYVLGAQKKWFHGDGSFECPQHRFWLRNISPCSVTFTVSVVGLCNCFVHLENHVWKNNNS